MNLKNHVSVIHFCDRPDNLMNEIGKVAHLFLAENKKILETAILTLGINILSDCGQKLFLDGILMEIMVY